MFNLINILWLLYKPRHFFYLIDRFDKSALIMPVLLSATIAINQKNPIAIPVIFAVDIISAFVYALIYSLFFKISKRTVKILPFFSALLFIDIIPIFFEVARLIIPLFIPSKKSFDFSVISLALLFQKMEIQAPTIFKFLTMISVSALWVFLLHAIALSTIGKISIKRGLSYAGILFLLSSLFMTFLSLRGA